MNNIEKYFALSLFDYLYCTVGRIFVLLYVIKTLMLNITEALQRWITFNGIWRMYFVMKSSIKSNKSKILFVWVLGIQFNLSGVVRFITAVTTNKNTHTQKARNNIEILYSFNFVWRNLKKWIFISFNVICLRWPYNYFCSFLCFACLIRIFLHFFIGVFVGEYIRICFVPILFWLSMLKLFLSTCSF